MEQVVAVLIATYLAFEWTDTSLREKPGAHELRSRLMAAVAEQATTWLLACGHEIPRDPPANGQALKFPVGRVRCPTCYQPQLVTAASTRVANPLRLPPAP